MITDVTVISGVIFSAGTYGLNSLLFIDFLSLYFYCEPFFIILIYDSICKLFLYDKYTVLFYKYTFQYHFTDESAKKNAALQISSLPALQRLSFSYFREKSFSDMLIYRTAYRCCRTLSPTSQAC